MCIIYFEELAPMSCLLAGPNVKMQMAGLITYSTAPERYRGQDQRRHGKQTLFYISNLIHSYIVICGGTLNIPCLHRAELSRSPSRSQSGSRNFVPCKHIAILIISFQIYKVDCDVTMTEQCTTM